MANGLWCVGYGGSLLRVSIRILGSSNLKFRLQRRGSRIQSMQQSSIREDAVVEISKAWPWGKDLLK